MRGSLNVKTLGKNLISLSDGCYENAILDYSSDERACRFFLTKAGHKPVMVLELFDVSVLIDGELDDGLILIQGHPADGKEEELPRGIFDVSDEDKKTLCYIEFQPTPQPQKDEPSKGGKKSPQK